MRLDRRLREVGRVAPSRALRGGVWVWGALVVISSLVLLCVAGLGALVQGMIAWSHVGFHADLMSTLAAAIAAAGPGLLASLLLAVLAVRGAAAVLAPRARLGPVAWAWCLVVSVTGSALAGLTSYIGWLHAIGAGRAVDLGGQSALLVSVLLVTTLAAAWGFRGATRRRLPPRVEPAMDAAQGRLATPLDS